jgi:O-antigen/teichoic acid export membrane protein
MAHFTRFAAPPASGSRSTLGVNTVAQSAPVVVSYTFSLLLAPLMLSKLGLRGFGVWALTGGLAQYGALLNLGAGQAVSRFVAMYEDDLPAVGEYLGVACAATVLVAIALFAGAYLAADAVAAAVRGVTPSEMRLLLLSSAVIVVATMSSQIVVAYPIGLRRMVPPNFALVVGACLNFVVSIAALIAHPTLSTYAVANAGAGVAGFGVAVAVVLAVEKRIPIRFPTRGRAKELLTFSLRTQLTLLAALVNYQTDKIVIAFAVGPSAAGAYELANRVAAAARQVGVYSMSALMPTMTADVARGRGEKVIESYGRLTERAVGLSFPVIIFVAAMSAPLLRAWLGHSPPTSADVLAALCVAYLANVASGVGYCLALAFGYVRAVARTSVATALGNIALTVLLAPIWGVWGVLLGTVVALTVGSLVQTAVVQARFEIARDVFVRAVRPTLAVSAALAVPLASVTVSGVLSTRWSAALGVVLGGAFYFSLYLVWAVRREILPGALMRRLSMLSPRAQDKAAVV